MVDDLAETRTVRVVPYDSSWRDSFDGARSALATAVPEAISIEHVGSTSVPGLAAKPTVDILLVVDDLAVVLDRLEVLRRLGFEHRPGAFAAERQHLFFRRVVAGERTHHLHVLLDTSPEPDDYRLFRDFLRVTPEAAASYAAAKLDLATRFADDRQSYVAAKEPVVQDLLEAARRWRAKDRPEPDQ